MERQDIINIRLQIKYSVGPPLVFSSSKKPQTQDQIFLRKFMSKLCNEFLDTHGIFFDSEDDRFRYLKNEKIKLEILNRKNELIDVESVLMYMQTSNTLFRQEIENLEAKLCEQSPKKKKKIKELFTKLREIYSSDEFFSRIERKSFSSS